MMKRQKQKQEIKKLDNSAIIDSLNAKRKQKLDPSELPF